MSPGIYFWKCRSGTVLKKKKYVSHSVMSDSLQPHGLWPTRLLCLGILQARILECVATRFSRGSSWPWGQTRVSCIAGGFFTIWTAREAVLPLLLCYVLPYQLCLWLRALLDGALSCHRTGVIHSVTPSPEQSVAQKKSAFGGRMGAQLNDRKSLWQNEVLLTPGSPDSLSQDPSLCPLTGTVRNTQGLCAYVCV